MARIRVLRLLEYEYASVEDMDLDMGRWQVPANGKKGQNAYTTIKSATLPLTVLDDANAPQG